MKRLIMMLTAAAAMLVSVESYAQSVSRVTEVISGRLSRAGTTNRRPYDDSTLRALCEKGYTMAIYLYAGGRNREVSCSRGTIKYVNMTNWQSPGSIVSRAESEIRSGGRVMIHCWYGVHSSNYVSAVALNRMCSFSGSEAANYFRRGVPRGSLAQSRIDQLARRLEGLGGGSGGMGGCPSH